jgi:cation diffusion facilitator CzcD-associated flavoprotein CzcO
MFGAMSNPNPVLVIGAGPSGLAVSAGLARRRISYTLLEQRAQVGSSWRGHYERLHLHTVKQHSALPGLPFPREAPTYPSRQQVVDYLSSYAERFDIRPLFGQRVRRASYQDGAWRLETDETALSGRALVVASGYNRVPVLPAWLGDAQFRGQRLHSSAYKSGHAYRGKRVLVVGAGNSGAEIALDLWECGAEVAMSVRSPVHVVPRDLLGIPAQVTSLRLFSRLPPKVADRLSLLAVRSVYGDLSRYGLRTPDIGPVSQVIERGRIALIDVGTVALIKQGKIKVHPGIARFTPEGAVFSDGTERPFDAVVLATGYRAGLEDFLDDAAHVVSERGTPRWHGQECPIPSRGLYFIGFRNPLTGQLHDIAREAERIAESLAQPSSSGSPSTRPGVDHA